MSTKHEFKKNDYVLSDREEMLIQYLYENKIATPRQINRDIFEGRSKFVMYRKLSKLLSHSAIKKYSYIDELKARVAYGLSKKGFEKYILQEKANDLRRQFQSQAILHDIVLVDIRRRFLNISNVDTYFTENILQSNSSVTIPEQLTHFKEMNCDAVIKVNFTNGKYLVPVEYEANIKYGKRYDQILLNYYLKSDIEAVIYLCKNSDIKSKLMETEKMVIGNFTSKIFYCLLEDFLNEQHEMTFTNMSHQKLILK